MGGSRDAKQLPDSGPKPAWHRLKFGESCVKSGEHPSARHEAFQPGHTSTRPGLQRSLEDGGWRLEMTLREIG